MRRCWTARLSPSINGENLFMCSPGMERLPVRMLVVSTLNIIAVSFEARILPSSAIWSVLAILGNGQQRILKRVAAVVYRLSSLVDQVPRHLRAALAHCEVNRGSVVVLRIHQIRAHPHQPFHGRQITRRARLKQTPQIIVKEIVHSDHDYSGTFRRLVTDGIGGAANCPKASTARRSLRRLPRLSWR
jgi:hypothetical protein